MNDTAKIEGQNVTNEPGAAAATLESTNNDEMVSMSKAEYDKAIQSAEDRVRGKYSQQIRKLEDRIAELTPPQKTESELAFEKRLADLEAKERETATKEKLLNLQSLLQSNDIDKEFANYLNSDVDAEGFISVLNGYINKKLSASGYRPTGHQNNSPLSKDDYKKMSYDEMVEVYNKDPEARKRFKK